jgi:hypothetical protein
VIDEKVHVRPAGAELDTELRLRLQPCVPHALDPAQKSAAGRLMNPTESSTT